MFKETWGEKNKAFKKKREKISCLPKKFTFKKKRGGGGREKDKPECININVFVSLISFNAFSVAEDYLEVVSVCSSCGIAPSASLG